MRQIRLVRCTDTIILDECPVSALTRRTWIKDHHRTSNGSGVYSSVNIDERRYRKKAPQLE